MRSRLLVWRIGLPALFIMMLLVACENDINKIKALAAADSTKPIQQTTNIDLIYSDSALVKYRLNAPLMIEYMVAKPYKVLPKGIKITFLDKDAMPAGTITADSALTRNDDKFIELRHNVVATNAEGTVYKSEELIWDMALKQIYSNKQVEMTKVGGDIMRGTSFKSDDALKHPIFQNSTATIHVNGDGLQQ